MQIFCYYGLCFDIFDLFGWGGGIIHVQEIVPLLSELPIEPRKDTKVVIHAMYGTETF